MDPLAVTIRTRYLAKLFADEEAGRLQPLADYVQEFSGIEAFVREEYEAVLLRAEPTRDAAARYRPIEVIARGGMGQVTLALNTLLERRVALKSLRGPWHDARAVERLRREARVLGRLDHPAICRILDVIEVDGAITLVLPFHEGETLADRLHRASQVGKVARPIQPPPIRPPPRTGRGCQHRCSFWRRSPMGCMPRTRRA